MRRLQGKHLPAEAAIARCAGDAASRASVMAGGGNCRRLRFGAILYDFLMAGRVDKPPMTFASPA